MEGPIGREPVATDWIWTVTTEGDAPEFGTSNPLALRRTTSDVAFLWHFSSLSKTLWTMSETNPTNRNDEETEQESVPKTLATKVAQQEQAIRELLNPLLVQELTDERSEIRDRLRKFSDQDPLTFQGLVLVLKNVEGFFEDVEEEVPAETVEILEELRDKYGILSDEFSTVWFEKRTGAKNPWPTVSTTRGYNEDSEVPLLESQIKSEESAIGEFRVPPSHALSMAETLLAHAGYVIRDTVQNNEQISQTEVEQLCEELENLTTTASETREHVEALDNAALSSDGEATDDDVRPINDADYHIN